MNLEIYYDSESDTLSLWNGKPASSGADVAENLTVDLDAEGEAVGFTLEHASEILKAIGARALLAWNPEGFTLVDSERSMEMLKAVGERHFIVLDSEGLTPEDIEKWGIHSTV